MFNRRLLIDSGGEQQTYSVLEIHVDTPDGDHVRSARVELTYNGESNLANTDNKGIAVFYGVPTGTEISYTITAAGYNAATGKWIIPTDVEYETEYVVLSPLVNYNFKLTIGQNYDVEMGFYQSGFFKNDFGGISPAQFMQHTIEKVGIDAIMDTTTGIYMTNTLTVALKGDTRSSISQITIYVADSMYTLNTVVYNGGVTYYSLEMLNDTTVTDYFDRRNGKTVDIQLKTNKKGGTNMFNRRLLVYQGGTSEPPLPTKETVLWKGSTVKAFTITIPPGVKVLKIATEDTYVNEFVDPNLPRYIGVTGGKTYNIRWSTVEEGSIPEPEYWNVEVYRYNSSSNFKKWVSSYAGDAPDGAITTNIQIIMSYSASINGVTPNVLDY